MIIPTVALTLPGIAGIARLARATMIGTLGEDFVRTARAKGLDEFTVVTQHVARNSLVPVMTTVVGLSLVGLIEGAFFTETLLGIPGIGRFVYESVQTQDYNIILMVVLMTTAAFVMANLLVDIALVVIDPAHPRRPAGLDVSASDAAFREPASAGQRLGGESLTRRSLRRLLRRKLAVIRLVVIAVFYAAGIFAPVIAPYSYTEQNLDWHRSMARRCTIRLARTATAATR